MSGYIERDNDKNYWNDCSGTVVINDDSSSSNTSEIDWSAENLKRWDWLISGWAKMDAEERTALFVPHLHYINVRDFYKKDFDNAFDAEIAKEAYKSCRSFREMKYVADRQSTPLLIIVYNPINIPAIPDANIRESVLTWGKTMGFIIPGPTCKCNASN